MDSPHLFIVTTDGREHRFFDLKDAVAYATREIMHHARIAIRQDGKEKLVIEWK